MALEPIYEQDFLDCSYGFRPGRSAHQALDTLWRQVMGLVAAGWSKWIAEAVGQLFPQGTAATDPAEVIRRFSSTCTARIRVEMSGENNHLPPDQG